MIGYKKGKNHLLTALFSLVVALSLFIVPIQSSACTVGCANGSATIDGRPMMWKMRDTSDGRQQLVCSPGEPYDFIGVRTEGGSIFMGLSESGVCTGNAVVGGGNTSEVMQYIFRNFNTMDQIRTYFSGITTVGGNLPFIDAAGNASLFELNKDSWWLEYDTMDPNREAQGLLGLVVRANEFHNHPDGTDDLSIGGRYESGTYNINGLADACELSVETVTQGNAEPNMGFEYARYGPGRDYNDICRSTNRSFIAVHGVLPDEDPALSTMWFLCGNANYAIAVPTWVMVSNIPAPLASGDLYVRALSLYGAGNEMTTQESVIPAEAHMFDVVMNELLPVWRSIGAPPLEDANRVEHQMADDAYSLLYCLDNVQYDNNAPEVSITVLPDGYMIDFILDANDSDGTIQDIEWNFGDGSTATQDYTPSHTYTYEGIYLVSCTVTDDDGVSITDFKYVDLDDGIVEYKNLKVLVDNWLVNNLQQLAGQLIGRWNFDDGTLNDSSGNGHHGALTPGDANTSVSIVYDADRGNNVLDVNNPASHTINSVVDCGGAGDWADIRTRISIAVWLKVDTFHVDNQYLLSKGSTYQLTRSSSTDAMRTYMGGLSDTALSSSATVNDGSWHHVAVTYDSNSSERIIYIDGQDSGSDTPSGLLNVHTGTFVIGGRLHSSYDHRGWDGRIDDVRLYDYVLTPNDVDLLYQGSEPCEPSGFICTESPAGDLSDDCKVNFLDFQILAADWLQLNH